MSYEFGSKITREKGAFLRNLDLILLVNRASGNMFRYAFSNNSLVAVGKIDSVWKHWRRKSPALFRGREKEMRVRGGLEKYLDFKMLCYE